MEGKLTCSAENCVHNINGFCNANSIEVEGEKSNSTSETQCKTFASKGVINSMSKVANTNLVGGFKQVFTNESVEMSPHINCEAYNCIYNTDRMCIAKNIQIDGESADTSRETQCETFKKE